MKKINKKREPISLTQYKSQRGAKYDGQDFTPVKNDIRSQLLEEQGHLCAYCMMQIKSENMKVEHFFSQCEFPEKQLHYNNMLGCCKGNEGSPRHSQTCDTKKGNSRLLYSPSNKHHNIEKKLKFLRSGEIKGCEEEFNEQINKVLNLNYSRLKDNRKAALDAVLNDMSKRPGNRTKAEINKYIEKYNSRKRDNKFYPYYGFVLYFLYKKLRAAH